MYLTIYSTSLLYIVMWTVNTKLLSDDVVAVKMTLADLY